LRAAHRPQGHDRPQANLGCGLAVGVGPEDERIRDARVWSFLGIDARVDQGIDTEVAQLIRGRGLNARHQIHDYVALLFDAEIERQKAKPQRVRGLVADHGLLILAANGGAEGLKHARSIRGRRRDHTQGHGGPDARAGIGIALKQPGDVHDRRGCLRLRETDDRHDGGGANARIVTSQIFFPFVQGLPADEILGVNARLQSLRGVAAASVIGELLGMCGQRDKERAQNNAKVLARGHGVPP
jgi:hypothetical protein